MAAQQANIHPISGALGAEVEGVNLANPMTEETFANIRQALLGHLVIFFRDQIITPEQQLSFARQFGEIEAHAYAKGLKGNPEVLPVVKEADDHAANFGGIWHSDVSFHEAPPMGQVMYALEVPRAGGDTIFANMYLAYESLSDGMKGFLSGLKAIHTGERSYGASDSQVTLRQSQFSRSMDVKVKEDAGSETAHPVVRIHPETRRKSLFISAISMQRFEGMTRDESQPLLDFLIQHARRPEFTCRFRWRRNSIAFWDNRCTQHYALNDYHGHRRVMHRVTIAGDRPV